MLKSKTKIFFKKKILEGLKFQKYFFKKKWKDKQRYIIRQGKKKLDMSKTIKKIINQVSMN